MISLVRPQWLEKTGKGQTSPKNLHNAGHLKGTLNFKCPRLEVAVKILISIELVFILFRHNTLLEVYECSSPGWFVTGGIPESHTVCVTYPI